MLLSVAAGRQQSGLMVEIRIKTGYAALLLGL
jgi:hypothetical protein